MTCSHCGGEPRVHPCGWCEGTGHEPGLTRLQQAFTDLSEQVTPAPRTPPDPAPSAVHAQNIMLRSACISIIGTMLVLLTMEFIVASSSAQREAGYIDIIQRQKSAMERLFKADSELKAADATIKSATDRILKACR